jgi:hypothetical protein
MSKKRVGPEIVYLLGLLADESCGGRHVHLPMVTEHILFG